MSNMNMSVTIAAIDKFSAPAKKIAGLSESMTKALQKGQKTLSNMGKGHALISNYKALGASIRKTSKAMREAHAKTAALGKAIAGVDKPSRTMIRDFEQAKRASSRLKASYQGQLTKLRSMRGALQSAGVDTKKLGAEQKRLAISIAATTKKMERQAMRAQKMDAIHARRDKGLQRAANLSFVGSAIGSVGRGLAGAVAAPVERMRGVQRSRGELQSLSMSTSEIDAVVKEAHSMTKAFAGIDTASFTSAAYAIKSGIGNLTGEGVAKMTALAALTAKATKSDTGGMTSLFATGYGVFKKNLVHPANASVKV